MRFFQLPQRVRASLAAAIVCAAGASALQAQIAPVILIQSATELRALDPYRFANYVTVTGGRASGVTVAPRVYATAAHVVFDNLAWVPASSLFAYPANHRSAPPTPARVAAVATYRWDSYRLSSIQDQGSPSTSSYQTFNLDFAAVSTVRDLLAGDFAPVWVDEPDRVSVLRQRRRKTIVGYPADTDYIPSAQIGFMHQNAPGFYETYWASIEDEPRDGYGNWWALYSFEDVVTRGGNSGGPVFIEDPAGAWHLNALLVGGDSTESVVRGIDAAAWALVEQAAGATGFQPLRRVDDLAAVAAEDGVALAWTDRSAGESAYRVERRGAADFAVVAVLPADAASYLDASAAPGTVYQYRVTPLDARGNAAPPSAPVAVETPGPATGLATTLGAPFLYLRTRGDAPAASAGTELQTGLVWSMEGSAVELELIGPGELRFTWAVSSEENPDYDVPSSRYYREIYDAFYLFRNGAQEQFISGEIAPREVVVNLPAGPQTLRWEYRKDPYSDEGLDRGTLRGLRWTPQDPAAIVYGERALTAPWREAAWFGRYTVDHLPWSYHAELGWLHLRRVDAERFWAYARNPALGWLYVTPGSFPFVWSSGAQSWLYYLPGSGEWFFDYAQRRWRQLPTAAP